MSKYGIGGSVDSLSGRFSHHCCLFLLLQLLDEDQVFDEKDTGEGGMVKDSVEIKGEQEEEESESDDEDDVQIHIGPIETQPPPFYTGRMPIAPSMFVDRLVISYSFTLH